MDGTQLEKHTSPLTPKLSPDRPDQRKGQSRLNHAKEQRASFRIVNEEVGLDREHARALVELLLPGIKQRMEAEQVIRAG
jgi:hypothetical protein